MLKYFFFAIKINLRYRTLHKGLLLQRRRLYDFFSRSYSQKTVVISQRIGDQANENVISQRNSCFKSRDQANEIAISLADHRDRANEILTPLQWTVGYHVIEYKMLHSSTY